MIFKSTTAYQSFFNILPQDWRDSILPVWDTYRATTRCYVLVEGEEVVAGGLVFSECPPDMLYAKDEALAWFEKGYQYLGFIYVKSSRRNQNLGSLWLNSLKQKNPQEKYWLTIEDLKLDTFYIKNGFKCIKSLNNDGVEEVLYTYTPEL